MGTMHQFFYDPADRCVYGTLSVLWRRQRVSIAGWSIFHIGLHETYVENFHTLSSLSPYARSKPYS